MFVHTNFIKKLPLSGLDGIWPCVFISLHSNCVVFLCKLPHLYSSIFKCIFSRIDVQMFNLYLTSRRTGSCDVTFMCLCIWPQLHIQMACYGTVFSSFIYCPSGDVFRILYILCWKRLYSAVRYVYILQTLQRTGCVFLIVSYAQKANCCCSFLIPLSGAVALLVMWCINVVGF